jgi:hypothetical protein
MFVAPITTVRCLPEQLALHVHDRLMPRKRERGLVPIDPHHLMAVVADEMNFRPNEARWTIRHQLALRTAERDALGHGLPSIQLRQSVEPQTTPEHEQLTPSAEG